MRRARSGELVPTIPSLSIRNGEPAPLREVPVLTLPAFRDAVLGGIQDGRRIAALFGQPLETDGARLIAVLAHGKEGTVSVCSAVVGDAYPALTPDCPQAHWFEREVAEQWGVRPLGHPWLKRLRFHGSYRTGHDGWPHTDHASVPPGVVDFFRVEGEEVHEVAVGPVHAGIIEPGHFRFQCHGENVLHLEISLGYQHRGVERALVGGPNKRTIHYMETLAGDTSVGHATAYCQALEALGGVGVSARADGLRRRSATTWDGSGSWPVRAGCMGTSVRTSPPASSAFRRSPFPRGTRATCLRVRTSAGSRYNARRPSSGSNSRRFRTARPAWQQHPSWRMRWSSAWSRAGAERSAMSRRRTIGDVSRATRSSIPPSTIGWGSPWLCAISRSPTFRCATRASTCRTVGMISRRPQC